MADKILSFGGILLDGGPGPSGTQREVRLYYHLEDHTIQLVETPTPNSGTVQGTLVGRQRVPLSTHPLSSHLTLTHLKVGETVTILGRTYFLTSCDPATRIYLTSLGLSPKSDLCDPSLTAYQDHLPAMTPAASAGKLKFSSEWPRKYPVATFVNKSGQVLRFFGEWVADPKEGVGGGVTSLVTDRVELRYYLEDDSTEVRVHHLSPQQDVLTPARPRQPTKLLKRGPVAKNITELNNASSLGAVGRPTLNLVGLRGGRAHLKDRRPQAPMSPDFLHPKDLVLGKTVDVAGRLMKLCECDNFTTNYYKTVYGIDQHPVGYSYVDKQLGVPQVPRTQPLDPRWLEGSPSDPLHPFPTTVTTTNHNAHTTRDGYEHVILRFGARLVTEKEKDREREFVINFYCHDSTVSVFEVPKINSGMRAGMFLGRGLVVSDKGGHVGGKDLYAGNIVRINSHTFYITHADEFTLSFMEEHADEANYNVALNEARRNLGHHELTSLLHQLAGHDPEKKGYVRTDTVVNALIQALGKSSLTRQQIQALARRHRHLEASPFSRETLAHLASLHLKRHNFDGLPDLNSGLQGRDTDDVGRLPRSTVRAALKATRLPMPTLLVDALVDSATDHDGMIDYQKLCYDLDYRLRPHIHDNLPCQLDEASLELGMRKTMDATDYVTLVADLEGSSKAHHFAGSGLV